MKSIEINIEGIKKAHKTSLFYGLIRLVAIRTTTFYSSQLEPVAFQFLG